MTVMSQHPERSTSLRIAKWLSPLLVAFVVTGAVALSGPAFERASRDRDRLQKAFAAFHDPFLAGDPDTAEAQFVDLLRAMGAIESRETLEAILGPALEPNDPMVIANADLRLGEHARCPRQRPGAEVWTWVLRSSAKGPADRPPVERPRLPTAFIERIEAHGDVGQSGRLSHFRLDHRGKKSSWRHWQWPTLRGERPLPVLATGALAGAALWIVVLGLALVTPLIWASALSPIGTGPPPRLPLTPLAWIVAHRFIVVGALPVAVALRVAGWRVGVLEIVVPATALNAGLAWVEYRHAATARTWIQLIAWGAAVWMLAAWALIAAAVPWVLWNGGRVADVSNRILGWSLDEAMLRAGIAATIATACTIGLGEERRRNTRAEPRQALTSQGNAFFVAATPMLWALLAIGAAVATGLWKGRGNDVLVFAATLILHALVALGLGAIHRGIDWLVLIARDPSPASETAELNA